MKLISIRDDTAVRAINPSRQQYVRTVCADTEMGDTIDVRGELRGAWVRIAGDVRVREYFVGCLGPDRKGAASGLFIED